MAQPPRSPLTDGPLAPVRAALDRMIDAPGQPPVDGIAPGLVVADRAGWVRASTLTAGPRLDDLLGAAERRWPAAPHVSAALAWKSYTYWLALPAVLGYAAGRRVPLVRPAGVLLRWGNTDGQPFLSVGLAAVWVAVLPGDPLARLSAAQRRLARIRVLSDDDALLRALRSALVREHLAPLVRLIRGRRRLGPHTLWGALASGVAHAVARAAAAAAITGPPAQIAGRLLDALGVADLVDVAARPDGSLAVHRHTCCLAFHLPQPKICRGCVLERPQ